MVDCGESDKMIKISGKMDKSNTYKAFIVVIFHSFIPRFFFRLNSFFFNFFNI